MARLRYAFVALLLLVAVGTVGYHQLEQWGWFDSLYMTVITLSTVGYREPEGMSSAGRLFTVLLIVLGVGTVGYVARVAVETLFRFDPRFVQRRAERKVRRLQGHLVLCGAGRTGGHILQWTREAGEPAVVVEKNARRVAELRGLDYLVIQGDAREEETLEAAGVQRARGLICALEHDADSLFTVLTARSMSSDLRICARAREEGGARRLLKAGADWAVSGAQLGAERLVANVLKPTVVELLETASRKGGLDLALEELPVRAESPFAGKRLREAGLRPGQNVLVVAVRKGGGRTLAVPTGETWLEEGDHLVALGQPAVLRALRGRGRRAGR